MLFFALSFFRPTLLTLLRADVDFALTLSSTPTLDHLTPRPRSLPRERVLYPMDRIVVLRKYIQRSAYYWCGPFSIPLPLIQPPARIYF